MVANMLIDMRVALESDRSLLYATAQSVDMRDKLEEYAAHLKAEGRDSSDVAKRQKYHSKVAALLTPMCKYTLTENANKIAYDSLQIHGGTGYMREFKVERLARDARITNIYEGTTQLQVVAAIGGVINDILKEHFEEKEQQQFKGNLQQLADQLKEIREIFLDNLKYVQDKNDKNFQDVAAKELVELYSYLFVGYLLLDEAEKEPRKVFIANRYIMSAAAKARKNSETIKNGVFADILHADEILI
jgi:hypothetical protein